MNNFIHFKHVGYQLKRNRRLMVLMVIGLSILYPIALIFDVTLSTGVINQDSFGYTVEVLKMINLFFFFVIAALMPLLVFRYLTSKKELDAYGSLPIKSRALFLTNFFTAMLLVLIPQVIVWLFGFGVQMAYGLRPDGLELLREIMVMIAYLPIIMAPAMIAINNIGTLFDSFLYTGVLQILPFVVMLAIQVYGDGYLFTNNTILTEPVTSAISYHYSFFNSMNPSEFNPVYIGQYIWPIVGWLCILLNTKLYQIRKVEYAEQPLLNKWFTRFVIYIFTVIVLLIAVNTYNFSITKELIEFLFPVLFILVLYLIVDAITHRGFSHFFIAILEFMVLLAISVGLMFGLGATNGFGIDRVIPDADDVEKVVLSSYDQLVFTDQNNSFERANGDYRYLNYFGEFTDDDDLETIVDFHHEIVDTYYEYFDNRYTFDHVVLYNSYYGEYQDHRYHQEYVSDFEKNNIPTSLLFIGTDSTSYRIDYVELRFDYYLEDGSELQRNYSVPIEWMYDLLELTPLDY